MRRFLARIAAMPRSQHLAGIAAVGMVVGAIAWYRLTRLTPESDPHRYWAAEGARVYSSMATVPVKDAEGMRWVFFNAPVEDPQNLLTVGELSESSHNGYGDPALHNPLLNEAFIRALREAAFDFLYARLNAEDPAQYVSWMLARGYRFKSAEEFERRYGPLSRHVGWIGVESDDLNTLFDAAWRHELILAATPVALCTDASAAIITIGRIQHGQYLAPRPHGRLGIDLWIGRSSGGCRFWMQAPVTREGVVAAHGWTLAANVGVIVDVPDSGRRPLLVHLFLDPATSQWWVDGVSVNNHIAIDESSCTEY